MLTEEELKTGWHRIMIITHEYRRNLLFMQKKKINFSVAF